MHRHFSRAQGDSNVSDEGLKCLESCTQSRKFMEYRTKLLLQVIFPGSETDDSVIRTRGRDSSRITFYSSLHGR